MAIKKGKIVWDTYGWFNLLCQVIKGGWFNGMEKTPEASALSANLYRALGYLDRESLINNL